VAAGFLRFEQRQCAGIDLLPKRRRSIFLAQSVLKRQHDLCGIRSGHVSAFLRPGCVPRGMACSLPPSDVVLARIDLSTALRWRNGAAAFILALFLSPRLSTGAGASERKAFRAAVTLVLYRFAIDKAAREQSEILGLRLWAGECGERRVFRRHSRGQVYIKHACSQTACLPRTNLYRTIAICKRSCLLVQSLSKAPFRKPNPITRYFYRNFIFVAFLAEDCNN
jgi:hypothetical protein